MDNKNQEEVQMVPKWQAEQTYMHLGKANSRMLAALITVCVTFILTIIIFVVGYTIREHNWLRTITNLGSPPATEVQTNGVHE